MIEVAAYEIVGTLFVVFLLGFGYGHLMALSKARQIFGYYKEAIKDYRKLLGYSDD